MMVQSAPPATKNMYRLWSTAPVSHERKYQAPQRKQDVSHICRKPAYPPLPSPPHAGNRKDRGRHPPPEVSLAHPSIPSHPIHTYTNKPSTTTKPIPSPKFQNNKSSLSGLTPIIPFQRIPRFLTQCPHLANSRPHRDVLAPLSRVSPHPPAANYALRADSPSRVPQAHAFQASVIVAARLNGAARRGSNACRDWAR